MEKRTLDSLRSAIRGRLFRPELSRGQVGIKIVKLDTGTVVFEQNSEKYFMPASNMKNFTVAAAIEKLSPDYKLVTSVYAPAKPDASGTVAGDLRIYGRGDVSISNSFYGAEKDPTAYFAGMDKLADAIAAAGVKRVEGSIIGDDSYFSGGPIPSGWEWDDLQWYYGAEVSALPINDNVVDLSVKPGTSGSGCVVTMVPETAIYQVNNQCKTQAGARTLKIEKDLGDNRLMIMGNLPAGNAGFSNTVTASRPAELFASILKQRLELKGITVTGSARAAAPNAPLSEKDIEITRISSPPLGFIAAKTMKPSQNMYTEVLLRTLGEEARKRIAATPGATMSTPSPDSTSLGVAEVRAFLASIGVPPDSVVQFDGSGLSRHNLITPAAVVSLYTHMAQKSRFSQAWRDSLTIAGVDGTLRGRFRGTRAEDNFRGKTGTIDQVSALSGYLTTAGGERLVASFIVNGVPSPGQRTSLIDDIVVMLADFDGAIDQLSPTKISSVRFSDPNFSLGVDLYPPVAFH